MKTPAFVLSLGCVAIALAGATAMADAQDAPSSQFAYVTKVPLPSATDSSMPQIVEVDMNAQQLAAPGPLSVRVLTSSNVNAVFVHVEGQTFGIPLMQSGRFELAVNLPTLPSYMKGRNYQFDFEALTSDGKRAHVDVPVFITL